VCVIACPWPVPVSRYGLSLTIPAVTTDYSGGVKPSICLSLPICSQGEASEPAHSFLVHLRVLLQLAILLQRSRQSLVGLTTETSKYLLTFWGDEELLEFYFSWFTCHGSISLVFYIRSKKKNASFQDSSATLFFCHN